MFDTTYYPKLMVKENTSDTKFSFKENWQPSKEKTETLGQLLQSRVSSFHSPPLPH